MRTGPWTGAVSAGLEHRLHDAPLQLALCIEAQHVLRPPLAIDGDLHQIAFLVIKDDAVPVEDIDMDMRILEAVADGRGEGRNGNWIAANRAVLLDLEAALGPPPAPFVVVADLFRQTEAIRLLQEDPERTVVGALGRSVDPWRPPPPLKAHPETSQTRYLDVEGPLGRYLQNLRCVAANSHFPPVATAFRNSVITQRRRPQPGHRIWSDLR